MIKVGPTVERLRPAVRLAVRWGLPVLWLLWAGPAWWSAPRQVPAEQLARDAAAGRVVTAQRADGWNDDLNYWGARPQPQTSSTGWMAVWTLSNGQVRYADLGGYVGPGPDESVPGFDSAGLGSDGAAGTSPWSVNDAWASLRVDTRGSEQGLAHRLAQAAVLVATVIGLCWLVMLVAGPAPAAGTRWFWFWVGLLPFGLGVLAYWFREWRFTGHPEWEGRGGRSGWLGLGWLIFGGIALSLLVFGAQVVLGRFLVPG